MHRIPTAAQFIHANMPLGRGGEAMTIQQAWDVAAFIDHHPRPQDPRFTGDMAETAARYHSSDLDYYGKLDNSIAGPADGSEHQAENQM